MLTTGKKPTIKIIIITMKENLLNCCNLVSISKKIIQLICYYKIMMKNSELKFSEYIYVCKISVGQKVLVNLFSQCRNKKGTVLTSSKQLSQQLKVGKRVTKINEARKKVIRNLTMQHFPQCYGAFTGLLMPTCSG